MDAFPMAEENNQIELAGFLRDSISLPETCFYQIANIDTNIPIYAVNPTCATPPLVKLQTYWDGSCDEKRKLKNQNENILKTEKRSRSSSNSEGKCLVDVVGQYNDSEVPDSMQFFSVTHQMHYQVARQETEVTVYNMVSPTKREEEINIESPEGKMSRNSLRRKRQRERMKMNKSNQESEAVEQFEVEQNKAILEKKSPLKLEIKNTSKVGQDKTAKTRNSGEKLKKSPRNEDKEKLEKKPTKTKDSTDNGEIKFDLKKNKAVLQKKSPLKLEIKNMAKAGEEKPTKSRSPGEKFKKKSPRIGAIPSSSGKDRFETPPEKTLKAAASKTPNKTKDSPVINAQYRVGKKTDSDLVPVTESVEKLQALERDFIYPLKKKSIKFPRARFFCRLCEYHMDDCSHASRHMKDNRHQSGRKVKLRDTMLANLPPPCEAHYEAITKLLAVVVKKHELTPNDVDYRRDLLDKIRGFVFKQCPDAVLRLYGSSVNGFGLKTSDVNIELKALEAPTALKEVFLILKKDQSGYFKNVRSDFSATVPAILCNVPSLGGVLVRLGVTSQGITLSSSFLTSELLRVYCSIDPRVRGVGVPFRLWAKFCGIDDQESGTLPAYAFGMMTVFFLQQCDPPVLPVLHQTGAPTERPAGASDNNYFNDIKNLGKVWKCENTDTVGQLWIKMCRFYALDIDMKDVIVCIRSQSRISRSEKKWTKRLAIEDPFQRKRNISRSISHSQVFDYIYDELRNLYQYFGIPQTSQGPIFKVVDDNRLEEQVIQMFRDRSPQKLSTSPGAPVSTDRSQQQEKLSNSSMSPGTPKVIKSSSQELIGDSEDEASNYAAQDIYSFAAFIVNTAITSAIQHCVTVETKLATTVPPPQEDSHIAELVTVENMPLFEESVLASLESEDLRFKFSKVILCPQTAPKICALCHKHGHLQQTCPDIQLPKLKPLLPITNIYKSMLDRIISKVPNDFKPSDEETSLRDNVVNSLEKYIREIFPDACLCLFGSSCNGFGFSHSDMDICMILQETKSETVDYVEVIKRITRHFRKHAALNHVMSITSAKVPIVKFKHWHSGLDGDISLYNTLAVHNTRMLNLYSNIDYRVKALGYTMKVFAKLCDICDASKGSLSSYAYILMVIYFLQQRDPPVIPVLQELYKGKQPEVLVDGWNAWFYEDIKKIKSVWNEYGKNQESLAQLWIGLLRFYTEEFNFKDCVISIRQKGLMTRFEKLWNGKCIAIEDPFDLSHNLGGGLSRRMDAFIMKAFHNGRSLFGTSVDYTPPNYNTLEDYLFDPRLLTDSAPPSDRNCRSCGKIGHWARECPKTNQDHNKKNNEDQEENVNKKNRTPVKNGSITKEGGDNQLNMNNRKRGGTIANHSNQQARKLFNLRKEMVATRSDQQRTPSPSMRQYQHQTHANTQQQQYNRVNSRVFYNTQRGSPNENVSVSPRAMYINQSPQQQIYQQQQYWDPGVSAVYLPYQYISPNRSVLGVNPVQQLFNAYGGEAGGIGGTSPRSLPNQNLPPMPLMALQMESPMQQHHHIQHVSAEQDFYGPIQRSVQVSPQQRGSALTWQQQQFLQLQQQQQEQQQQSNKRTPQRNKISIEDEFPNLGNKF